MVEKSSYSYGSILFWASNEGYGDVWVVVVIFFIGVDANMAKVVGCCVP